MWLVLVFVLVAASTASAHQVCVQNSTGKFLEYQTWADPGTCTANAVSAGYAASDVTERQITAQEWAQIKQEHVIKPNQALEAARKAQRLQQNNAVLNKLNLTPQEVEQLKAVLGD